MEIKWSYCSQGKISTRTINMFSKSLERLGFSGVNYPGHGQEGSDQFKLSQAVIVPPGKQVWVTGQMGWTEGFKAVTSSLTDHYLQAFENVALALAAAGSSWEYVFKVESFHAATDKGLMGPDFGEAMGKCIEKYLGDHRPAWTAIGSNFNTDMKIEIQVYAAVPE